MDGIEGCRGERRSNRVARGCIVCACGRAIGRRGIGDVGFDMCCSLVDVVDGFTRLVV